MILRTNGRFIAFNIDDDWKILVKSLKDYQALIRQGYSRDQLLIRYE